MAACLWAETLWLSNYCDYIRPCCSNVKQSCFEGFLPFYLFRFKASERTNARELRDVQHVKISQIMSHTSVGAKWVWICAIQGGSLFGNVTRWQNVGRWRLLLPRKQRPPHLACSAELSLWIMRAFSSQRGRFCWSVLCNNWESPVVIFCVRVCVCVERISGLSIHVCAYTEILVFFGKVVIIFKAWKWKSEHFEHYVNSWSF